MRGPRSRSAQTQSSNRRLASGINHGGVSRSSSTRSRPARSRFSTSRSTSASSRERRPRRRSSSRLRDREFLILIAEAPLPDDPGMIAPVSFKVVHELRAHESETRSCSDLVARAPGRRPLRGPQGSLQLDWRHAPRLARAGPLPRAHRGVGSLGAFDAGIHEVVVKTKNRFYDMRGTLDQLEFDVVKYEPTVTTIASRRCI